MKKRILSMLIVLVMVVSILPVASAATPFTDVSNQWYAEAVDYVYSHSLMEGTSAAKFSPNANMTRAMVVTVLYRMEGEPAVSGQNPFTDVPAGTWYTDAVVWANESGITTGITETSFAPAANVTRQQLVTFLYRYMQAKDAIGSYHTGYTAMFSDAGQIAGYAREAFEWAVGSGILNGDSNGKLNPAGLATRAECAAILQRSDMYMNGIPLELLIEGIVQAEEEKEANEITWISGLTDLLIGENAMKHEVRGEKATLIAYTKNGTAENVTWTSSNESVVTVSEEGVIWAKGVGEAVVTASNKYGSLSVDVTVSENMTLDEVLDTYFADLLDLGDISVMSADDLVAEGNQYFYIPHSTEGTDDDIIKAAKDRTFTDQVAFYCKAEAYYEAALAKEPENEAATAQLAALNEYRDLIQRLDPDGQGICFTWFSNRNSLSPEQRLAFAYDDVFFFAEPQYRGMDTLIETVGDKTEEGINQKIAVYRFNAIYLGKGGAYTEISRFFIDRAEYPDYPKSMDIGIDYLKWSFDPEVVSTTDFKGPRYLGDYYASGWTNDNGQFVEPDYEAAMACYNVALSNKGAFDLTACIKMAFWYYDGEITEKNDTLAFTYLVYGFYQGSNLHATQTNMPEGLLVMGNLFRSGVEGVDPNPAMAVTFYTYAYKSAEAMIGHNDEVEDEDMVAVMAEVTDILEEMGEELDDDIVIGTAADDFDKAFENLLKPYIGMIETYLGVKGVK